MPFPSGADYDIELPGWARLLAILAVGVAISGVIDFALTQAGHANLGAFAWATGYAGTIIVLWLVWGRDLELVGDTGVGHESGTEENPANER
jgi:hypothetical protein